MLRPTLGRITGLFGLSGALLVAACEPKPRVIADTEGRSFEATCDKQGNCQLKQLSGAPNPEGAPRTILQREQRLLSACYVPEGYGPGSPAPEPAHCRALICEQDSDCPPRAGEQDGACVNQLCISTTGTIGVSDSVMMCLAGTGLGRNKPEQIGLFAMALNCGNPCAVPKPCRQP